jgi:predicted ferric reductase
MIPVAGFWLFCQSHPFSIAWWSEDEKDKVESVLLLVKTQHGINRRLATINPGELFIVVLEGPYGQPMDTSKYGTLVLFATGIGIVTQLSVLKRAFMDY